jgi:catechol 2,3-dioxygenase-like lactoylglutathione lyase family enzyme
MVDRGLTHVALPVSHPNDSIAFYPPYARMQVVYRRTVSTTGFEVAWRSDTTRPFVIVLSERNQVDRPLFSPAHLGVACASQEEVERLCALARGEGRLLNGPRDAGPPIGYVAALRDPDGHTLEVSCGQGSRADYPASPLTLRRRTRHAAPLRFVRSALAHGPMGIQ